MNTNEFFDTVERVFHDWHYDHPRILYALIRALKPQTVVEVGTYRGYAACYMARALQENGMGGLFCIDNFSLTDHTARYGDAKRHLLNNLNICGVAGVVTLIEGNSDMVAWPERVDLAYIDGWHSYLASKFDFEQCAMRGATCICLDDTLNCIGPRKLVSEIDRAKWDVLTLGNDNGLSICQKKVERRITFSQELPNNPGTVLTNATDDDIKSHLAEAFYANGVDYSDFDHG